jgi:C-terminal processing protease CtpA/Prc
MRTKSPGNFISRNWLLLLVAVTPLFLSACKDDEDDIAPEPIVNAENKYVNDWIQENMDFWYLWNESLPLNTDRNLAPDTYFTRLLNKDDRFSWLQPNYQELIKSLDGINMEGGFEYVLYRESNESDNVVAQILYVKPNSPASTAGLKRGDLITKINSVVMTTSNYRDQIAKLKQNHTLTYKPLVVDEERFDSEKTADLTVVEYSENPNHLSKVIETDGRKIGYFVYTFFSPGEADVYDLETDQVFQEFKNAGITDLVVDLRFNSGGSEVSARNLASLIGSGVNSSVVFFKRQYNTKVMEEIRNTPTLGESFLTSLYNDETANIGSLLTGGRVYMLTSSRTASASELIINSLRPYMEVFLIGDVTYGKNVGSISIYEENDSRNTWGLQPIVVKVANSLGTADYAAGFVPDITNEDNSLYLYPLGDERENLLAEAIAHITGKSPSDGRLGVSAKGLGREVLQHSLDENPRSFRLFMDNSTLPRFDR